MIFKKQKTEQTDEVAHLRKSLGICYKALEYVTRPMFRLSPDPICELLGIRRECRDALMAAKAEERNIGNGNSD